MRVADLAQRGAGGRDWYRHAEQAIRRVGGDDWDMLARLLATLSPQSTVEQNTGWAVQALRWYREEGRCAPAYGTLDIGRFAGVRERVNVVLNGGEVTGQKCVQFYRGLTGDTEAVAIDRFVALAMGHETAISPRLYDRMARDLRWVAHNELGWEPRQLQAALWVAAPRHRAGGDMAKQLERSQHLLLQGQLWVGGPRGQRRPWEVSDES